jgi:two-component system phosphate regulon sensor histidine kinase PhoR
MLTVVEEFLVGAFIALQAVALAIALSLALSRRRVLDTLREATDEPGAAEDLEQRIRRLTDRTREAEFQAQQVARDTATLADILGVGIVRVGDGGVVDFANATAHAFLGRPAGALTGRTPMEAFVDRRVEEVVATARATGSGSTELTVRDGATLTARARRSPVAGIWLVLEDVSELRRLQQIRAEFIDNLSHELRTPLTTVSLLAETLTRDAQAAGEAIPERMRDRIDKIEIETGHLVQMVNELLDLSRIESGGPLVLLDDVDLGRLAATSTDRLRLFAERQGVRLRTEVPGELPPVRGDEARIGQVLVNLLHNAVKFSPEGGDVVVRVREDAGELVTSVEDHGIGIPKAVHPRIFERFYKVDAARVRGGGTGLGLAIARHVIGQHGGRIWVESEEGSGSTFSFALPIAQRAA